MTVPGSADAHTPGDGRDRRVALVDDHEIMTMAVGNLIADTPGLEFVGAALTVGELLAKHESIDLVVLDLRLADGSAVEDNVARLRQSGANVLGLTSGESPFLIRAAAKADVLGIVRKSAPASEIIDALVLAAHGDMVTTTDWAAALDADPEIAAVRLGPRERQVLELYASGRAAKQVATELGIAENTVDHYLKRIRAQYAQVGRASFTKLDLYRRSVEDGYLPQPAEPQ